MLARLARAALRQYLSNMSRRTALLFWIALVVVSWVAPPTRPDVWEWVQRVMVGDWAGENPLLIAQFNLMGVWPVLYGILLAPQWRNRPIPAWPFVAASMFVGGFSLLVFFIVRGGPPARVVRPNWTRWLTLAMGITGAALMGWGLLAGDPGDWFQQWQSEGLVYVMTADFLILIVAFAIEARAQGVRWPLALIPIVGTAACLWATPAEES